MENEKLIDILQIKGLLTEDLHDEFQRIAEHLFKEFIITVDGQKRYRFIEVEFYYQSNDHFDPYVHAKDAQKTICKWYSHPAGIDLTFGNGNAFGGILIRGLYDEANHIYINKLLKIRELLSNYQDGEIKIVEDSNVIDNIFSSTRVGLTKKKSDDKDYFSRKYRFICDVCVNNKFREKEKVMKIAYDTNFLDLEGIRKYLGYVPKILTNGK